MLAIFGDKSKFLSHLGNNEVSLSCKGLFLSLCQTAWDAKQFIPSLTRSISPFFALILPQISQAIKLKNSRPSWLSLPLLLCNVLFYWMTPFLFPVSLEFLATLIYSWSHSRHVSKGLSLPSCPLCSKVLMCCSQMHLLEQARLWSYQSLDRTLSRPLLFRSYSSHPSEDPMVIFIPVSSPKSLTVFHRTESLLPF